MRRAGSRFSSMASRFPIHALLAVAAAAAIFSASAALIEPVEGESRTGEFKWLKDGGIKVTPTGGKAQTLAAPAWRRVLVERPKIHDIPGLDAGALGGLSPEFAVGLPPGIITVDGSFVAGSVTNADDSVFALRGGNLSISTIRVGVVLFHHLPPKRLALLGGGRRGVLLRNGDFVDGEFQSVSNGSLKPRQTSSSPSIVPGPHRADRIRPNCCAG